MNHGDPNTCAVSYSEALKSIEKHSLPLPSEIIPLDQAYGRCAAEKVVAAVSSPRFDNSAVDGYAFGHGDPPYRIIGDVAAGAADTLELGQREATRISTGAPIPTGTSGVAMLECCTEEHGFVRAHGSTEQIRRVGEDFEVGELILREGDIIDTLTTSLLAQGGVSTLALHRLPKVSVLTTGNELVSVGQPLLNGQIYDSNSPMLVAALKGLGIEPSLHHVRDEPTAIAAALESALEFCDVLITCGGVSVGDHDHLRPTFMQYGFTQIFWGVTIKPGRPLYFGCKGDRKVFGLPGNPVSALVTFYLFARPTLLRLMGCRDGSFRKLRAALGSDFQHKAGRTTILLGNLQLEQGGSVVIPIPAQSSHRLLGIAGADCLILIPEGKASVSRGDAVDVIPLSRGFG